jgi:hypothetical protein
MVIEFPSLGAPQRVTSLPLASPATTQTTHPSSIASQAVKASSFLDCLLFIPRQIWNLIQTLFCCQKKTSQNLAGLIENDPTAAVKKANEMIDAGQKIEVRTALADAAIALAEKAEDWEALTAAIKASGNSALRECLEEEIAPLRICATFAAIIDQHDRIAKGIVDTLLAFGYTDGIALIRRCFAPVDVENSKGLRLARENAHHLNPISKAIKERTRKWNAPASTAAAAAEQGDYRPTATELEIHRRLPANIAAIFSQFSAVAQ